jgi:hypothetical protein
VKVHNGFNSALMSVFEDVRRFILKARANNPTLPLYAALPPLRRSPRQSTT